MNIRFWIATALLAGSWLFGRYYFYPADAWMWLASVVAAVLLLGRDSQTRATWRFEGLALVLLIPAVWLAPWPYRAAPLLLAAGLALRLLPMRARWINWLAGGAVAAGVVMFVQAFFLEVYIGQTAASHDLPWPLPDVLAGIAKLLGIDAAADGHYVAMHSMRQTHRLAATWELLFDPATLLFFVGSLTMLPIVKCRAKGSQDGVAVKLPPQQSLSKEGATAGLSSSAVNIHRKNNAGQASSGTQIPPNRLSQKPASEGSDFAEGWRAWIGDLRVLTLVILAWLPIRAGLLLALHMQRVLRADPEVPLHTMNHIFSPWMLLTLLIVPVLLAWRFIKPNSTQTSLPSVPTLSHTSHPSYPSYPSHLLPSAALIAMAAVFFTWAVYWDPPGQRKDGRVIVVERHSEWEPTTRPYDTKWFVEPKLFDEGSGYNYARIYRYLDQFYDMSRLLQNDKIDDAALAECDVLIIKTPTERYSPDEIAVVRQFVERGGGLLLIGEHTNYERSSTVINDIIRPMGFIFRDDLVLSFNESPYEQSYAAPTVPHPIVQRIPVMDFAGSCSIDPGTSRGRPFFADTGLWNMGPEYHHDNFFPFPQHCPEMRYGPFIQGWTTRYGKGRVTAFTDSTIFSNFCVGQPGKSELMLGMVEWLNRSAPWLDPRPWLFALGLITLGAGVWLARCSARWWLVLLAAASCGWAVGSMAIIKAHDWAMRVPERISPECRVVVDRTVSDVPLAEGLYPRGNEDGYGMFEAWLSRMNCQSERKAGLDAFAGDVSVVICPDRPVSEQFLRAAKDFVEAGGRLLVIDSPENTASTANALLQPFDLRINRDRIVQGKLTTNIGVPSVEVERACEVTGGEPLARLGTIPVVAISRHGKGSVMAIGFGSLWNDTRMGESWMFEPDAATKARYDVMFGLLEPFLHGQEFPKVKPQQIRDAETPSGLKESGPAEL